MFSKLIIIDASACVYTGMYSKRHKDKSYYGYPVGGLHYLFRYVVTALAQTSHVIVAFDSRSFRKDLIDGYKAGRKHDKRVQSQLEMAYEFLQKSNVACYKYDGYEADDIIAWAVQQNVDNYLEIEICGNDHDLLHNVQRNVMFRSISSNTTSVYMVNFEKAIEKGKTIYFNTISAYKVFCGCNSDKIPPLALQCGLRGEEIYDKYIDFLREEQISFDYNTIIDSKLVNIFAALSGLFTTEERLDVLNRVNLVYPAKCPEGITLTGTSLKEVNANELCYTLSLFNDFESIKCLRYRKSTLAQDDINMLRSAGRDLLTGAFEVDRNQECSINKMDSFEEEDLFLKDV